MAAPAPAAFAGTPILMYHMVDPVTPKDAVGRSLTVSPVAFAAQLAWLRDHHIQTITVRELVADLKSGRPPRNAVVLTVDDGYADAATVATPLLERYGDRATFYISAGFVGDGRHVSWAQLRTMQSAGMEIGCHGTFHRDLTTLSPREAAFEVNHCVTAIARYVGRPTTYAYAAGRFNGAIEQLVRAAHFDAALTELPRTAETLANRYDLPRRRIDRSYGLATFAALATP
jgi:peptidoglycan/xylan/chitin deacetylase (PgdA/CDA1 family)